MSCIIATVTFNQYDRHSILPDTLPDEALFPDYAEVPEELEAGILETQGFCDLLLSDDGRKVLAFVPRPIPDLPEPDEPEENIDVWDALDAAYQEGVDSV